MGNSRSTKLTFGGAYFVAANVTGNGYKTRQLVHSAWCDAVSDSDLPAQLTFMDPGPKYPICRVCWVMDNPPMPTKVYVTPQLAWDSESYVTTKKIKKVVERWDEAKQEVVGRYADVVHKSFHTCPRCGGKDFDRARISQGKVTLWSCLTCFREWKIQFPPIP